MSVPFRWAAVALSVCALIPARAAACGGFFCSTTPINQAAESIIYGLEDDGSITMAVQIRYSGFDEDFAWILPVPAPPELSIGTEALFAALEPATRPRFTLTSRTEGMCREVPRCYAETGAPVSSGYASAGCGGRAYSFDVGPRAFVPLPPSSDAGASVDTGPRRDGGVEIVSMETVGAYESVVLGAATAVEVVDWLQLHGYQVPSSSAPLLDAYAAAGQYFVALRLSPQRTTTVLRPIVLHIPTSEACLPIRLTAIATVPEMPITAIFLGRERVVPRNYSLAEPVLGAADVGLWVGGLDWQTRVSEDVRRLGGHAFVTDFAGPTPPTPGLELESVLDLSTADVATFVQEVGTRGYPPDTDLQRLFSLHLDPPAGESITTYVNCLFTGSVAECGVPRLFDAAGLADAIETELTAPRREAEALVRRLPYATRLFTTMRAADMTIDPVFVADAGLPDVRLDRIAEVVTRCSASYFEHQAPRDVVVGGEVISESAGPPSSDSLHCRTLGGVPEAELPPGVEPMRATTASPSGSCFCSARGAGGAWRGAVLLVAALAIVVRQGRRSRRPRSEA